MEFRKEMETTMADSVRILNLNILLTDAILKSINKKISGNIIMKFEYEGKLMSPDESQDMLLSLVSPTHTFKNGTKTMEINLNDICYITCSGKLVFVRMTSDDRDERHHFDGPLKDVCDNLPKDMFFKIGRSTVVNLYHVESVTEKHVIMKNGREFPLTDYMGESSKAEVKRLREMLNKDIHSI